MSEKGIWGYHPSSGFRTGIDLVGYKVEAADGGIGKIDKHSEDVDASHIVVNTGAWIFGKEVLLPAGVIERIDTVEEKVYVSRTKEQIKGAPELDRAKYGGEPGYLEQFARYYGHM
ncbi:PRC-barrel domain containing protein [Streptomyces sp. NPDC097981]|uniref:PRC-barrel domain containing protein n=1 Tax=Streptomyces sp. NPDC097981 TaxID=3155428 RepID=UPI00331FA2EC